MFQAGTYPITKRLANLAYKVLLPGPCFAAPPPLQRL